MVHSLHLGMVESFQEVELGLPQFSDITVNGDGLEAASTTSIKSEATEEQSQTKAEADKSTTAVSSTNDDSCFCIVGEL